MPYLQGNKNQGAHPSTFKNAVRLRFEMTPHESLVWNRINKKQILLQRFRRQHPISTYILDFFCVGCRLSIEIDGEWHKNPAQLAYDLKRTAYLNSLGITELRFSNQHVERDLDAVIGVIKENVEKCIPPLTPKSGTDFGEPSA